MTLISLDILYFNNPVTIINVGIVPFSFSMVSLGKTTLGWGHEKILFAQRWLQNLLLFSSPKNKSFTSAERFLQPCFYSSSRRTNQTPLPERAFCAFCGH